MNVKEYKEAIRTGKITVDKKGNLKTGQILPAFQDILNKQNIAPPKVLLSDSDGISSKDSSKYPEKKTIDCIVFKDNIKEYWLDIVPCAKPRMTQRDKWKKRPIVEKYYRFKDLLKIELKKNKINSISGYIPLIEFGIPMPTSWSKKKKKEMNKQPHRQRPDGDNLLKAFQDAIFIEDNFIYDVRIKKSWSEKGYIYLIL